MRPLSISEEVQGGSSYAGTLFLARNGIVTRAKVNGTRRRHIASKVLMAPNCPIT